jgi:hypothetical protein
MSADTIQTGVAAKKSNSKRLGRSLSQPDTCLTDRLLRPFRNALARLLHPMMGREEELFASLEYHVEQIQQQQRRLDALVRQVAPDNAKDRLIAFEERIQLLEAQSARGGR